MADNRKCSFYIMRRNAVYRPRSGFLESTAESAASRWAMILCAGEKQDERCRF
jgi:hypothetical protein